MDSSNELSSVYDSDEFRMYVHKVLPCSKRSAHDWASCPFSHPGEKARRRNVRTHSYDCEMCPEMTKGQECKLGSTCPHSHNVFESWLHPQKYRTMMCKDRDKCSRSVCFFAHGPHELRTPTMVSTSTGPMPQQQQQQQQLAGLVQQSMSPSDTAAAAAAAARAAEAMQSAAAAAVAAAAGAGGMLNQWQLVQGLAQLARAASSGSGNLVNAAAAAANAAAGTSSPTAAAPAAASLSGSLGYNATSSTGSSLHTSGSGRFQLPQLQTAGSSIGSSMGSSDMASMQQLLSSLVNEVNISRQEAQQSRDAAAQAQQQFRALAAALATPESSQQHMVLPSVSSCGNMATSQAEPACFHDALSGSLLPGDCTMLPIVGMHAGLVATSAATAVGAASYVDGSEASSGSIMELSALDCTPASSSNLSELSAMTSMFGLPEGAAIYTTAGAATSGSSGSLPQVVYSQLGRTGSSSTSSTAAMAGWLPAGGNMTRGSMPASAPLASAYHSSSVPMPVPGMQLIASSPSGRQDQQSILLLGGSGGASVGSMPGMNMSMLPGDWSDVPPTYFNSSMR